MNSPFSLFINSITEAMFRSVQLSLDTSRTIKAETSVHHWSKDITLRHSQGFGNASRPNSLRKNSLRKKEVRNQPQTGINAGALAESLTVSPMPMQISPWLMTAWGHKQSSVDVFMLGRSHGEGGGEGRGDASAWNPLPWPSKHQMRSRRRFIWSRAQAALRWERDSPWIYYPTNPESGALCKSSTDDCCCFGPFAVASDVRAVFFLFCFFSLIAQLTSQWSLHLVSLFSHVLLSLDCFFFCEDINKSPVYSPCLVQGDTMVALSGQCKIEQQIQRDEG